jgi:hypothetical protein
LLKAAAIYFVMVFGAGFVLGPFRVLVLEPRVGTRVAELLEAPVMLVAIVMSGRWVGRRWGAGFGAMARLGVGLIAAGLVLVAEIAVGVGLRGMSVVEVLTGRDSVSGTVYCGLIALSAIAPWLFGWRSARHTNKQAEPGDAADRGGR